MISIMKVTLCAIVCNEYKTKRIINHGSLSDHKFWQSTIDKKKNSVMYCDPHVWKIFGKNFGRNRTNVEKLDNCDCIPCSHIMYLEKNLIEFDGILSHERSTEFKKKIQNHLLIMVTAIESEHLSSAELEICRAYCQRLGITVQISGGSRISLTREAPTLETGARRGCASLLFDKISEENCIEENERNCTRTCRVPSAPLWIRQCRLWNYFRKQTLQPKQYGTSTGSFWTTQSFLQCISPHRIICAS